MFRAGRSSDQVGVDGRIKHSPECGEVSGTVAGAATFDRKSTASWISPGVSPIRSTDPR